MRSSDALRFAVFGSRLCVEKRFFVRAVNGGQFLGSRRVETGLRKSKHEPDRGSEMSKGNLTNRFLIGLSKK